MSWRPSGWPRNECYMPYWHEHDLDSSPRSICGSTMSDYAFEEWTGESNVNNQARDVVYHMKQVDQKMLT
eukprot:1713183-Prorocentrum_lima.AAC.1